MINTAHTHKHRRTIRVKVKRIATRDQRVITGITIECESGSIEIPVKGWFIPHDAQMPRPGMMTDAIIEPDGSISDLYLYGLSVPL